MTKLEKHRVDVFISSTSYDLPEHRKAVMKVLNTLKLQPVGMEYWAVTGKNPVILCREHVFSADIFVGIYAYRYGWCPPNYKGKSITEMEYDWAIERIAQGQSLPMLCFLMSEDHPDKQIEVESQEQLKLFKARIKENHIGFFKSADDLATQLALSLPSLLGELINRDATHYFNLVPPPDHFVGRNETMKTLLDLMAKPDKEQVISIKGIGGIGKTTFVKALAQAVSSQFRLILWAELGEQWRVDAELRIMQTWADLANREFTSDISTDRMAIETRRALTKLVSQDTKPILLIIDDVWPETVRSVRLLREAAPLGTQVVITTRSEDVAAALNSQSFLLDKMNPSDGSSLLAAIVNHPAAKKDLLVELSALLGGHALSLELIGRYLRRNFQPQRLLKLIAELRQGLENGSSFKELRLDTGDSKVESFSVSLNQTLNALSPRRQGQFRALGVMPSELPFRSSHVMAIWKEDDWQGLDDLVAEGLLTPVSDKEDQYTQHRLLRAYARALLRSTDHLSETQELHWNYIIKIAQDTFGKPLEYWEQSRDDIPQIHAIGNELVGLIIDSNNHPKIDDLLRAFSEHGNLVSSPQAMGKFDAFLKAVRAYILERYIGVEGLRWLLAGLAISRTKQDLNGIAAVSSLLGLWHEHHGNKREALRYHTLSLETDKSLGNQTGQATTLNNIGAIHFTVGEYHDAFECFEEALSLSYRTDDISTRANALSSIGRLFHALGDSEQALKYFREAIDLFQRTGDEGHEAITLTNMGLAYQRLNKLNASLGCYHKALKINDKSGDSYAKAATLNNMGLTYNALRKPQKALSFFQKALTLVTQVGNLEGEAKTHGNIATMLWQQGETETAKQQMQIASRILHDLDLDASDEDFMLKEWNKVIR